MANETDNSLDKAVLKKRFFGLAILLCIGFICYPIIFSSTRPGHQVDETSIIPANNLPPFRTLNIVEPKSTLDAEKDQLSDIKEYNSTALEDKFEELENSADEYSDQVSDQEDTAETAQSLVTQAPDSILKADGLPRAWVIQVVSLSDPKKSEKVLQALLDKDFKAYSEKADLPSGIRYRVLVGPYLQSTDSKKDKQRISKIINTKPVILNYEL